MEKERQIIREAIHYAKSSSGIENLAPTKEEMEKIKELLKKSTSKPKIKGKKK